MYCKKCGNQLEEGAKFCTNCGCNQEEVETKVEAEKSESYPAPQASGWWTFLGFMYPVIGLIFYLVFKNSKPSISHKSGKGALIGAIVSVALYLIIIVWYIIILKGLFAVMRY